MLLANQLRQAKAIKSLSYVLDDVGKHKCNIFLLQYSMDLPYGINSSIVDANHGCRINVEPLNLWLCIID